MKRADKPWKIVKDLSKLSSFFAFPPSHIEWLLFILVRLMGWECRDTMAATKKKGNMKNLSFFADTKILYSEWTLSRRHYLHRLPKLRFPPTSSGGAIHAQTMREEYCSSSWRRRRGGDRDGGFRLHQTSADGGDGGRRGVCLCEASISRRECVCRFWFVYCIDIVWTIRTIRALPFANVSIIRVCFLYWHSMIHTCITIREYYIHSRMVNTPRSMVNTIRLYSLFTIR